MRNSLLRVALALSVLVNVGVIGAIGYRALESRVMSGAGEGDFPGLVRHLQLSEEQQRRWREAESGFVERLRTSATEIHERRDRLIAAIFAPVPDARAIEAERAAIALLQEQQQRLVIEQLLREREMLDAQQRERFARLLSEQPVGASSFEELHRD